MTQEEWNTWQKSQIEDPRWKEFRKRILRRDNYSCRICGRKMNEVGSLHIHHLYYIGENGVQNDYWDYPDLAVVTLCSECHTKEHDIKSSGLYDEIQSLKKVGKTFAEIKSLLAGYREELTKAIAVTPEDVYEIKIGNVGWKTRLSKRAINILAKNRIIKLGDLQMYRDCGYKLENMVGRKAYNAINRLMNEYGMYIKFGI